MEKQMKRKLELHVQNIECSAEQHFLLQQPHYCKYCFSFAIQQGAEAVVEHDISTDQHKEVSSTFMAALTCTLNNKYIYRAQYENFWNFLMVTTVPAPRKVSCRILTALTWFSSNTAQLLTAEA